MHLAGHSQNTEGRSDVRAQVEGKLTGELRPSGGVLRLQRMTNCLAAAPPGCQPMRTRRTSGLKPPKAAKARLRGQSSVRFRRSGPGFTFLHTPDPGRASSETTKADCIAPATCQTLFQTGCMVTEKMCGYPADLSHPRLAKFGSVFGSLSGLLVVIDRDDGDYSLESWIARAPHVPGYPMSSLASERGFSSVWNSS